MALPVAESLVPRGSGVSAPPRRSGSVRRTSTLDFTFPDGLGGDTVLDARARDLRTPADGSAVVAGEARVQMVSDSSRVISAVGSVPARPSLQTLAGSSCMSGFRRRLAQAVPQEGASATLLHALLDDVPGATLVSGSAFQGWYGSDRYWEIKAEVSRRVMTDVCTGYQRGSSALQPDGTLVRTQRRRPAVGLCELVDDDLAWHEHPHLTEASMRRARRTDVWISGSDVHVDAFFQDSATLPGGGRVSIHEYVLTARADLATQTLTQVEPVARVLPYQECPLAVLGASSLAGTPLSDLRDAVLAVLAGPRGCTHLNDMLRSLAGVPALLRLLPGAGAA